MAQTIQRGLASAAFLVMAILPMSPAVAQTQRQHDWCVNKGDAFPPGLRIDGCTATIRSSRQSGENLSWAFYNRGIAYAKKGQYDRAIADFDQAIKLDPDSTFALNNRGAAYARKGQYDSAIDDFNEAIRLKADSATPFNNRGTVYAKIGKYDRAIEDFDQAIALDPNDVSAHNNRRLAKQLKDNTSGATSGAESDVASAFKDLSPAKKTKGNASGADTNDARALNNGSPPKQIKGNTSGTEAKDAYASKSRSSRSVKSKGQLSSVRSHRPRPQSGLVRFFRKHQLFPDLRKVFRIASQRKTS